MLNKILFGAGALSILAAVAMALVVSECNLAQNLHSQLLHGVAFCFGLGVLAIASGSILSAVNDDICFSGCGKNKNQFI